MPEEIRLSFEATAEKGDVSAVLVLPETPVATLVLGHGAGAGMDHAHMQAIAESLARVRVGTLRFNFPFKEAGGHRVDSKPVCTQTIGHALELATEHDTSGLVLVGGHSFGGRMASHYAAETDATIDGLVYFSFPLHTSGKPGTSRAAHMASIECPQLFLSGTRDALADLDLLRNVVAGLKHARLHALDTADHSFRILKRSRKSDVDIYAEAAGIARDFVDDIRQ